ncbi:MAG: tetratricopeptide repeat protein [Candidatus Edwardsbacteria bacterium]
MRLKKRITKKEMKQDEFVLDMLKLTVFVQKHLTEVIAAGIGVVVIAIGVLLFLHNRAKVEEESLLALTAANVQYFQGKYQEAETQYQVIIKKYSGTSSGKEALLFFGNICYFTNRLDEAIKNFETCIRSRPNDELITIGAMEGVANVLEEKGNYLEAAKKYEEIAQRFSKNELVASRNLLNAGRCYEVMKNFEKANENYQKIIEAYPDSPNFSKAKTNLSLLGRS